MFSIASTFLFTVLTHYSFYRYILHQDTFFQKLTRLHVHSEVFFSFYAYVVIYTGSLIARQVNVHLSNISKYTLHRWNFLQGKKTSELLHDIINSYNDVDITAAVIFLSVQSFKLFTHFYSYLFFKQLAQMSLQIRHRYPVATCGLFTFDWTLLYSVRSQ